jgi:RND family efflux transporter MFP subunit
MKTFIILLFLVLSMSANTVLHADQKQPIPVTVKPLKSLLYHPVKQAPAKVVTLNDSVISAEISAVVESIPVEVGFRVKKNQVLATLDCSDYELNKQQLESEQKALKADQAFARFQYDRSSSLLESKSISREIFRRHRSSLNKISAQLELLAIKIKQADKMISRCQIKAPYDGVILHKLADVGEGVNLNSPLIRMIDTDSLEVEAQAPLELIDELQRKSLNFVYRQQKYPLQLRVIMPNIETQSRHQRVRFNFIDEKAPANAFGFIELTIEQDFIPSNYLLKRNNQAGIFYFDRSQSVARFVPLKGALIGRDAKIELPEDTQIIIDGRNALEDGQSVTIRSVDAVIH